MTSKQTPSLLPKHPLLIISGATASGKSRLALDLAMALNGVILNADSLQVYADLPVLTAHPTQEDFKKAPHRLYGILSIQDRITVYTWIDLILKNLEMLKIQKKIPILVGGTGFYIKALLEGLSPIPPIPPEIREKGQRLLEEKGLSFLWESLKNQDLETISKVSPQDSQRILRAWEVLAATQKPLSFWQKTKNPFPELERFQPYRIFLNPARNILSEKIKARTECMMERGALKEVEALLNLPISSSHPLKKAVGVSQISAYLRKEISHEEAMLLMQIKTCQYAKRQTTWFKHQFFSEITYPFLYEGDVDFFKNLLSKE